MKLESREYKLMLDHLRFADVEQSVAGFWSEMKRVVAVAKVEADGELKVVQRQAVCFLDTPDRSFRRNGYLLRRRNPQGKSLEFTLKCRSPDRFIAAGAKVNAAKTVRSADGVKYKRKLEEDIATPFESRFSLSATLSFNDGTRPGFGKTPKTVEDCATLFPVIKTFEANGRRFSRSTRVERVNGIEAYERVFEGGTLHFQAKGSHGESVDATVALILWSLGEPGRPLVGEFSFKYKNKDGNFNHNVAAEAKQCFERLQRTDWALPGGTTKTAYAYGE